MELLKLIGKVYIPFLEANDQAARNGDKDYTITPHGFASYTGVSQIRLFCKHHEESGGLSA